MKTSVLAVLAMTILGFSGQSFAKLAECTDSIKLNVQGQELSIVMGPVGQAPNAKLSGRDVQAYISSDMPNMIVVQIPHDMLPKLDATQLTSYDARLDHHSITEYLITVEGALIKKVIYSRHQDIDYGTESAENELRFTSSVSTRCLQ